MEPKQNIVDVFEAVVKRQPAKIAICSYDVNMSYGELNQRANNLAYLIRQSSINNQRNIALLLDPNEEIIVGILGVLKAGKTYVPIDPLLPLERCKKVLNDSNAVTLITTRRQMSLASKLQQSSAQPINILDASHAETGNERNPSLKIRSDQSAYILYTSGSTGQPKGVEQSHDTVVKFIACYIKELDINESDNILLTTPYSHTVSVIDIFSALFAGATLSILNIKKNFAVHNFSAWLQNSRVSILHTVPTFYRYFAKTITEKSHLNNIRLLILGGEEVFEKDIEVYKEKFSDNCLLINLYGSSEVILATLNIINKAYLNTRKIVPIGYPFDIVKTVILDENKKEVHAHGIGEIYFSSEYLNPRYFKDPQGTDNLSVSIPEYENQKFVTTGDLVKLLPDGSIQLVGRKDNQVKINGNRVHTNEIEVCLDSFDVIEQSAVVPIKNENGNISLVAYIKTSHDQPHIESGLDLESIKEGLRQKLPEYMIPSFFVKLEKLPTTSNGKIDRNRLPKINYSALSNHNLSEKTALQKAILKIWKTTFEKEDITLYDNFFQLGGNSLIATEIINKLSAQFKTDIELSALFDHQTIFELSKYLESRKIEQDHFV